MSCSKSHEETAGVPWLTQVFFSRAEDGNRPTPETAQENPPASRVTVERPDERTAPRKRMFNSEHRNVRSVRVKCFGNDRVVLSFVDKVSTNLVASRYDFFLRVPCLLANQLIARVELRDSDFIIALATLVLHTTG